MNKDSFERYVRRFLIGPLVFLLYRILRATWRLEVHEPDLFKKLFKDRSPFVLAHWHGDEVPLLAISSRYRVATITSTSKDGEMINSFLWLNGVKTSRGSSTRGAVNALKGLIRFTKQGYNTSFAVDGPKGPIHVVKPGVFELSRIQSGQNGGHIFVAGVACDKKWVFHKAWNKAFLPKPFAKIVVVWQLGSDPITKNQDPRSEELALSLANALRKSGVEATKLLEGQ